MAQLKDVIGYGLHANRPTAGSAGTLYYETDTQTLFRDNGSTWDTIGQTRAAFHGARLFHSTTQTLVNSTVTALTFDTVVFDTDSFHSSGSPTRLTIPTGLDGYYLIGANIRFPVATAHPETIIRLNGTTFLVDGIGESSSASVAGAPSTLYHLAASDYIELVGYQSSGSDLTVASTSAYSPVLWIARQG